MSTKVDLPSTTTTHISTTESPPSVVTLQEKELIEGLLAKVIKNGQQKGTIPSGFQFDTYQKECWARLLKGRDLLVALRTGGGKFMIAALAVLFCHFGVCCMMVPLDMLILEHVQSLLNLGIPDHRIVILKQSNMDAVVEQVKNTKVGGEPLYVLAHPERFVEIFRKRGLARCKSISVLIVDEVQLVKEWGMGGFRVAWRLVKQMLQHHEKLRFLGLSASINKQQRTDLCKIIDIDESAIFVGDMSRRRLKLDVVDATGLHPRTVDNWKTGTAKVYQMERILSLLMNDSRGVIVWIEGKKGCEKFCTELNQFFVAKGKTAECPTTYTANTYYSDDSTHTNKAVLEFYANKEDRVLVGTVAFMFGLNLPPTQSVVAIGCPGGLSPYWQLIGRANRTRNESIGLGLLFYTYKKYRYDMARAREKLSFVYEGQDGVQEAAAAVVQDIQDIYIYAMDGRLCLRKSLEDYFGGSQVRHRCTRSDKAPCGNCERKWKVEDARGAAVNPTDVTKTFGRLTLRQHLTEVSKRKKSKTFPKPRSMQWKHGDSVVVVGSVIPSNEAISIFLRKTIISVFKKVHSNSGIAKSNLAKKIASKTGKEGLKSKEVEYCLWWYMTQGYLIDYEAIAYAPVDNKTTTELYDGSSNDEENDEEDDEEIGEGLGVQTGETKEGVKTKKSWRVKLTNLGCLETKWNPPPLNERLGNFGLESDFFVHT